VFTSYPNVAMLDIHGKAITADSKLVKTAVVTTTIFIVVTVLLICDRISNY